MNNINRTLQNAFLSSCEKESLNAKKWNSSRSVLRKHLKNNRSEGHHDALQKFFLT